MNIRNCVKEDAPEILNMINEMYEELDYGISFNEKFVLGRLLSKFYITNICEIDGNPVGFSCVKITQDEYTKNSHKGIIYDFYVRPTFRKQGIAKALLKKCEDDILELEINQMELYVKHDNINGYDFWTHNDYKEKYKVLFKEF